MIAADQPTIFPSDLIVRVSSANDGTMLDRTRGFHPVDVVENRRLFCKSIGLDYSDIIYQQIVYDENETYSLLAQVDKSNLHSGSSSIHADGIITAQSRVGIMLPVADCVATVLYDPSTRQLAMLHLGRHSTLTSIIKNTISLMIDHGSRSEDILVWMSPNAQKSSYKLDYFEPASKTKWADFVEKKSDGIYVDLSGFNRQQCLDAGVSPDHIQISHVDTYTNQDYFSHSAGDISSRFVVVAMMS